MIIKRSLVRLTLVSSLLTTIYCLPNYSQTDSMPNHSIPDKQLPSTIPSGEINNTKIQDSGKQDSVQQVVDTLKSTGASSETIAIAVELVQVGADPESVINLMLNLNGLVQKNNQLNAGQLNRAITSYNTLIDKSDLQTLIQLKSTSVFMDIRTLLQNF